MKTHTIEEICNFFGLCASHDDDGFWRLHSNNHLIDQVEIPEKYVESTILTKYTPHFVKEDPKHTMDGEDILEFFEGFFYRDQEMEWRVLEDDPEYIVNPGEEGIIIPIWPGADITIWGD